MKLPRRRFLRLAAGAIAMPVVSRAALAQTYPARPVRIVVGFAAGGGGDVFARLTGQWLSERLGQSFFVENRPGAGSNIAAEAVVRATADGYTLLYVTPANAINVTLYEKANFNFVRDFEPVAGIVQVPNVMVVNASIPARTLPEFVAYAKANPGKINMASSGNGTSQHVSGELFKMLTHINMTHVPYRGGAPALTDLIGGQVQVMFPTMAASMEYVKTGKLRALAVTTATRSEALPHIPAMNEFVPGYEASAWQGIVAPKNTPPEIIQRLNREIIAAHVDARMKNRFADLGGTAFVATPDEFGKFMADETERWAKVVKFAGIKAA